MLTDQMSLKEFLRWRRISFLNWFWIIVVLVRWRHTHGLKSGRRGFYLIFIYCWLWKETAKYSQVNLVHKKFYILILLLIWKNFKNMIQKMTWTRSLLQRLLMVWMKTVSIWKRFSYLIWSTVVTSLQLHACKEVNASMVFPKFSRRHLIIMKTVIPPTEEGILALTLLRGMKRWQIRIYCQLILFWA